MVFICRIDFCRLAICWAILGLLTGWAGPCVAAEPLQLRVLSYNIHHGEGTDRQLDLERIAQVIQSVKPDLVALQEVDNKARRSGTIDQAAELGRLTGLHSFYGANIELQGGHYGNAMLSRFPFQSHRNVLLPRLNEGEQRGVIVGEFQQPGSEDTFLFLATHFDHRPNDEERLASVKVLNHLVKGEKRPVILAGDLNDVIESPALQQLSVHWSPTNSTPLHTWPSEAPKTQIDFIFLSPASRWKVLETRVLEESIASDHRAIFSIVELFAE